MSACPRFVSRAFRHTSIYVRTDRIKKPGDLKGKKVGLPEYQLTANVWARAILEDDHGVKPSDIHWVAAALRMRTVRRRSASSCRPTFSSRTRRRAKSISTLLRDGAIDGFIAPAAAILAERHPERRLAFPGPGCGG